MADEPTPNPAGEPVTDPPVEPAPSGEPKPDDEGLKKALNSERQLRAAAEKRLKAFEDAQKTELEKLQDRATAAEKERDELAAARLRDRVAAKHQLPPDLADLLTGTDEAVLEETAKRLATYVTPMADMGGRRGGALGGGTKNGNADDMNAEIRAMLGRR
jgi:hypothetical protein